MKKISLLLTMLLLLTVWAFGQDRTITGIITDETGAPVAGGINKDQRS